MSAQRILVTGGAGFIGSHTAKLLAASGLEPVVYDNLTTGNRDSVRWGPFVHGDILGTPHLARTITRYRPVAVIHFAASAYVGESVEDPAKYYRNNITGTQSLLDACLQSGVDKVIFSSSCATYGVPSHLPIGEGTPQEPINPYGRTKLIAEHMLRDYAAAYGLRYVALRYFNACGADPEGEIGEWHDPETHLIPRALMATAGAIPFLESSATTTTPPTAHASATTFTCRISQRLISERSVIWRRAGPAWRSMWGRGAAPRSWRYWTRSAASPGARCPSACIRGARATRRRSMRTPRSRAPRSASRPNIPISTPSCAPPRPSSGWRCGHDARLGQVRRFQ
jgi:hypothetical protein